jgi:hypothetical protein
MQRGREFDAVESPPVSPPRPENTPVLMDIVKAEMEEQTDPMVVMEEGIMEEMEEIDMKPSVSLPPPSPEVEVANKIFFHELKFSLQFILDPVPF